MTWRKLSQASRLIPGIAGALRFATVQPSPAQ